MTNCAIDSTLLKIFTIKRSILSTDRIFCGFASTAPTKSIPAYLRSRVKSRYSLHHLRTPNWLPQQNRSASSLMVASEHAVHIRSVASPSQRSSSRSCRSSVFTVRRDLAGEAHTSIWLRATQAIKSRAVRHIRDIVDQFESDRLKNRNILTVRLDLNRSSNLYRTEDNFQLCFRWMVKTRHKQKVMASKTDSEAYIRCLVSWVPPLPTGIAFKSNPPTNRRLPESRRDHKSVSQVLWQWLRGRA